MESYKVDNSTRIKNLIYTKNNIQNLITKLETATKKKLTKPEVINFINYIKEYNYDKIYMNFQDNIENINDNFIKNYMIEISKMSNKFDIHEYLKKEIHDKASTKNTTEYKFGSEKNAESKNVSQSYNLSSNTSFSSGSINISNLPNLMNKDEQIEFTKILNYQSLLRDSNILIDSRYQNLANIDRTKLVFNIISDTKNKTPGSGVITSVSNMKDILEIEIFPFSIPYISMADNFYKKITLSILELSSFSIDAYEDSQFHFIFQSQINGNTIELTPINRVFKFHKPITRISEFSLRFGSPLNPITFDKDRLYTSSISYNSNPGVFIFSEDHNLITGDLIYIDTFTTNNPAQDLNIINTINKSQGHICTRINNTTISINVDFNQILNPINGLSVLIYFGSKRILLPIRFRYLGNKDF